MFVHREQAVRRNEEKKSEENNSELVPQETCGTASNLRKKARMSSLQPKQFRG